MASSEELRIEVAELEAALNSAENGLSLARNAFENDPARLEALRTLEAIERPLVSGVRA